VAPWLAPESACASSWPQDEINIRLKIVRLSRSITGEEEKRIVWLEKNRAHLHKAEQAMQDDDDYHDDMDGELAVTVATEGLTTCRGMRNIMREDSRIQLEQLEFRFTRLKACGYQLLAEDDNTIVWFEKTVALGRELEMNVGDEENLLAQFYHESGDHEQALKYFLDCTNPDNTDSQGNTGFANRTAGKLLKAAGRGEEATQKFEVAKELFQGETALAPYDPYDLMVAHLNLACLLVSEFDELEGGLQELQRAFDAEAQLDATDDAKGTLAKIIKADEDQELVNLQDDPRLKAMLGGTPKPKSAWGRVSMVVRSQKFQLMARARIPHKRTESVTEVGEALLLSKEESSDLMSTLTDTHRVS